MVRQNRSYLLPEQFFRILTQCEGEALQCWDEGPFGYSDGSHLLYKPSEPARKCLCGQCPKQDLDIAQNFNEEIRADHTSISKDAATAMPGYQTTSGESMNNA